MGIGLRRQRAVGCLVPTAVERRPVEGGQGESWWGRWPTEPTRGSRVASAGFCALVAFNARELAEMANDADLRVAADALTAQLAARWHGERRTWIDHVVVGPESTAAVRTLDALLPVLVVDDGAATAAAFADVLDDQSFRRTVRAGREPSRRTDLRSHRLLARADLASAHVPALGGGRRFGDDVTAAGLGERLIAGATKSGLAEYRHPDTGEGLGAIPQSWTALVAVVAGQTPRS